MHQDYSENFVCEEEPPTESNAGKIAVSRLLAGERGHYGPLEHPQITLGVGYFPHSVMQQARTHRTGCCLGGDTLISFGHPSLSRGETYYQKTIKELSDLWHRGRSHQQTEADANYMKTQISKRSILHLDENTGLVEHTKIVNVYENGLRDLWSIRLANGFSIQATLNHKVLTPAGWKTFGDLAVGNEVMCADKVALPSPSIPEAAVKDEVWRQIPGAAFYEVSNRGNIRSWAPRKHRGVLHSPKKARLKQPSRGASGRYLYVSLADGAGGSQRKNVHELVLLAFAGSRPGGFVARHINGCATDNRLENLEWATEAENAADRALHGVTSRRKGVPVAIESIVFVGKGMTYDIEVEGPCHNFLANGIVVHNSFDVQSMRYTGQRICMAGGGFIDIEEVFYLRPPGYYSDRSGKKYQYTEHQRGKDLEMCEQSALRYQELIEGGFAEEHARGILPFDYRQHFVVSFSLRAFLHFLDLRYKLDAQPEIQTLCYHMLPHLRNWTPAIAEWYEKTRLHKARLAP